LTSVLLDPAVSPAIRQLLRLSAVAFNVIIVDSRSIQHQPQSFAVFNGGRINSCLFDSLNIRQVQHLIPQRLTAATFGSCLGYICCF
jgi:hypothetical protein